MVHASTKRPLAHAVEDPRAALEALLGDVRRWTRERPARAIGTALALGFVVGGAVMTRAGRAALVTLGRYALRELLKRAA